MNEDLLTQWTLYIREIAHMLRLTDWTLILLEKRATDDSAATIEHLEGRKVAYIEFGPDWDEENPEDHRHSIVHELLHLHHVMATDIIEHDLADQLPKQVHLMLVKPFRRQIEYMVDSLADVIAPLLPLPSTSLSQQYHQTGHHSGCQHSGDIHLRMDREEPS